MKTIPVEQFCVHYNIPQAFINSLNNYELIELIEIDAAQHIQSSDINRIERLMRMHYDLEVNMEGLDVINHLLDQIHSLQNELNVLRNRIDFYE